MDGGPSGFGGGDPPLSSGITDDVLRAVDGGGQVPQTGTVGGGGGGQGVAGADDARYRRGGAGAAPQGLRPPWAAPPPGQDRPRPVGGRAGAPPPLPPAPAPA